MGLGENFPGIYIPEFLHRFHKTWPITSFLTVPILRHSKAELRVDVLGLRELSKAFCRWVPRERRCLEKLCRNDPTCKTKRCNIYVFSGKYESYLALQIKNIFYIYFFWGEGTNILFNICSYFPYLVNLYDLVWNMIWLGHGQSSPWLVVGGTEGEVELGDQSVLLAEAWPHLMGCVFLPVWVSFSWCQRFGWNTTVTINRFNNEHL